MTRADLLDAAVVVLVCGGLFLWSASCSPVQCKRVPIVITAHPSKSKPAGRIAVGCDGKVLVEILADEVIQ